MNVTELQLKKKWDDEIAEIGILSHFKIVYDEVDHNDFCIWLNLYFKDLSLDYKFEIVNYAGENVLTNIKGLVDENEYVALAAYEFMLKKDFKELLDIIIESKANLKSEMKKNDDYYRDKIAFLETSFQVLKDEIICLKHGK